jgi:hypothetical protein
MGSVSGSMIPIVPKRNVTFRKRDILITQAHSINDTVGIKVNSPVIRTISSGSIVRSDGTVNHFEDRVWGVEMMARTTTDRVASAAINASRSVVVELGDNQTDAVIPTSLTPDIPQYANRNTGRQIVLGLSVNDTVIERVANTGVYGQ